MFSLPTLPYAYDALEPFYDAKTVEIHHSKHHQTYTDKLNAALKAADMEDAEEIEPLLQDLEQIPEQHRTAIKNHGGGYWNHLFFWESLAPNPDAEERRPSGILLSALEDRFGSFEEFQKQFTQTALGHFGSGWAWLVINASGNLEIIDTHDQDCPLSKGQTPLLTVDVWEHAYYLKFQNRRPEWIDAFFPLISWEKVSERYYEKS